MRRLPKLCEALALYEPELSNRPAIAECCGATMRRGLILLNRKRFSRLLSQEPTDTKPSAHCRKGRLVPVFDRSSRYAPWSSTMFHEALLLKGIRKISPEDSSNQFCATFSLGEGKGQLGPNSPEMARQPHNSGSLQSVLGRDRQADRGMATVVQVF